MKRYPLISIKLFLLVITWVTGCGASTLDPESVKQEMAMSPPLVPELTKVELPVEEQIMPTNPKIPNPYNSALSQTVTQAKDDLAQRLNCAIGEIEVVEVQEVIWPNTSMGCPQAGMRYKQVPQDGLFIRLSVKGQVYDYHSGGSRAPFLCEQMTKLPPTSIQLDLLKMALPPHNLRGQ